jgi:integrase
MTRPRGTGCLYTRPGSTVWWIKYSVNGRAFRESSRTTNKRQAQKFLQTRLGEIGTGTFSGPSVERVTIEELAQDYLRDYRINSKKSLNHAKFRWEKHLRPFFGFYRAIQVTSELIARYVDSRQQAGGANATINRELAALKRMFRLGLQTSPPKVSRVPRIPRLRENNVRTGFLEDGQFRKIVEYRPDLWFRGMIEVGRTYGWRASEVKNMRVNQVDLNQRVVSLHPGTTKNREGRVVTMTDSIYLILSECIRGKTPDDYVFTRRGKPIRSFRKLWARATEHAGCPGLLFHDLRRTAARNLRRAGVAEGVIQKIGGWKTRSVFERYNIVTQNDIADAMLKLETAEKQQEEKQEQADRDREMSHSTVHTDRETDSTTIN